MSVYTDILGLMAKFEMAHGIEPNLILLGHDEHNEFQHAVDRLLGPLKSDPNIHGTGKFFRGCRVLQTNEDGIWVGRMIVPS
jgi:hypothetical protein